MAAQFADLLWPTLLLLGVELVSTAARPDDAADFASYPYSHSLRSSCGARSFVSSTTFHALADARWRDATACSC
jgi:hypothetical protein